MPAMDSLCLKGYLVELGGRPPQPVMLMSREVLCTKKQRIMSSVDSEGGQHVIQQQARDGASVDGAGSRSSGSSNSSNASAPADGEPPQARQRQGPPPPPFNLGDDAHETFSEAFFEPKSFMASQRRELLEGKSVQGAIAEYLESSDSLRFALAKLSESLGVSFLRLREYYEAADMATKQRLAETLFHAKTQCDFRAARISVVKINDMLRPLFEFDEADTDIAKRTIDLSSLQDLMPYPEDEFLFSGKLYVRDCMRFVFGLFREDAVATDPRRSPSNKHAAVLIGSPGVGKSILFFLAALQQATRSPVVYYRRTRDELVSVFVMTPPDDGRQKVRVWFTRNMDSTNLAQGLQSVAHDLIMSGIVDKKVCYTFIDGPTFQRDTNAVPSYDTIGGNFDYFCTSGGFSGFASEQTKKRLWVLDGWREHEAKAALSLHNMTEDEAEDLFALCGGSIRGMILAAGDAIDFRRELYGFIKKLSSETIGLALTSTERSDDPKNPDRLRTMFEWREKGDEVSRKKRMMAYQMVDSRYALKKLCTMVEMGRFFSAYSLAKSSKLAAGQGVFFEHVVHQWAEKNKESSEIQTFKKVCWSSGTNEQCIEELSSPNLYWIPSHQNFPTIDSALVHNNTLYAFQMTISETHKFEQATFEGNFVDKVRKIFTLDRVVVLFLHPDSTDFTLPVLPEARVTRSGSGRDQDPPIEIRLDEYPVVTDSIDSIAESLKALFKGLE